MDQAFITRFVAGYQKDNYFSPRYVEDAPSPERLLTPSRFCKGRNGLLYFVDADWTHRLCVPQSEVPMVLKWIHDSPHESAHAGPLKFQVRLRELIFWPSMRKDAQDFADTCDICQKIKEDRRGKMGGLRPAHVPARPFATISMDLITGLPKSGREGYDAVLVFVDKLTRFGLFIPTFTNLTQEGFAKHFVDYVVNKHGMPERIIADRDRRWATAFWKSVVLQYGSLMALSSAHHPQTDGQTEILNATIEQMYVRRVRPDLMVSLVGRTSIRVQRQCPRFYCLRPQLPPYGISS